jgi:hypothetical protein
MILQNLSACTESTVGTFLLLSALKKKYSSRDTIPECLTRYFMPLRTCIDRSRKKVTANIIVCDANLPYLLLVGDFWVFYL